MFAMHILLFCTMLMAATNLRSVSQNFTGSGFLIPFMLRIAKNYSYSSTCHVFPPTVKQSGLMLLILMCGHVAMNPGPVMLGLVNARSIRNKGSLLGDTIASHTFDFLCLTETHIHTTDSDSLLRSLTPDGKAGSCLPLVGSLQYRTLANYMYWFPLPFQLPVVI